MFAAGVRDRLRRLVPVSDQRTPSRPASPDEISLRFATAGDLVELLRACPRKVR